MLDDGEDTLIAITKVIECEGREVLAFADAVPTLEEVGLEEIDLS